MAAGFDTGEVRRRRKEKANEVRARAREEDGQK